MRKPLCVVLSWLALGLSVGLTCAAQEKNLLDNPSFETTKEKNQFGHVFKSGADGSTKATATSASARSRIPGSTPACCSAAPRPRSAPRRSLELQPGRYKITAYLRGLDIGTGIWNSNTEFMFADKYFAAEEERHVRLDEADLRRRGPGEAAGRALVRPVGPRLLLDRRRVAGEGRAATCR